MTARKRKNKTRICVIGAGRWGTRHIRTLHELGCLGGIVESDAGRLAQIAQDHPDATCLERFDEAVGRGFDGFVVATPAATHFEIARYLLEQKQPVLVEKPAAMTVADARALQTISEAQGVPFMVGHVLLFHPAIRKIKALIDAGKIGRLQYLYSNRLNLGTVRTEENILWSFAPHDISIFQYFIAARPMDVLSRGGAFLQPHIHDSTLTILNYPENIVGHIFVSWLHPFKEHRIVVMGSKGMLSFEDSSEDKDIRFYEKGIDWIRGEPIERDGPTERIVYDRQMPLTEELRYFIGRLDGSPVEISGSRSAVEVLEILERATASLLGGDAMTTQQPQTPATNTYFVHLTSVIDDDVQIGAGTKIWHFSHVQRGARIGRDCSLGQNVNVGNRVRIGDGCKIQNNVSIYEGVELEDHVFCGPAMVFTNIRDPRCRYPQRGSEYYLRTLVRTGATIGANATIICGNTIGRHAFIGAGAVVTHDVSDYAVMLGVPARQTGWACECGEVLPEFDREAACPRCDRAYWLDAGRLLPVGGD